MKFETRVALLTCAVAIVSCVCVHAHSLHKDIPIGSPVTVGRVLVNPVTGVKSFQQISTTYYGESHAVLVAKVFASSPTVNADGASLREDATCSFHETLLSIGWNVLDVESNANVPDEDQMYAIGHCEIGLTVKLVYTHAQNVFAKSPVPAAVIPFLEGNYDYLTHYAAAHKADSYWARINLFQRQITGMYDALKAAGPQTNIAGTSFSNEFGDFLGTASNTTFTLGQFLSVVSMGDLVDLKPMLSLRHRFDPANNWRKMSVPEFNKWFAMNGHCSALFKVTDDLQDIFFGHTSFYYYIATLRIYKRIQNHVSLFNSHYISFSSYPGMISSFDDFYVTDTNLAVIETSLSVLNEKVYDVNKTQLLHSVLYATRVMLANYNAKSAPEWTALFAKENSGTYNNQWMVLDLNLFTPGQPLVPNTMWIAEQMPGLVKSRDVTEILMFGYFPSFNIPLDTEIYDKLGYPEAIAKNGPAFVSYQTNVRGQIFRRDQAKVNDLVSFQNMIQYNDFEHDPISDDNPDYAISSRMDIFSPKNKPVCFGGYDAKTSSYSEWVLNGKKNVAAYSGPTPQQPNFVFPAQTASNMCGIHSGLPPVFDFAFVDMKQ